MLKFVTMQFKIGDKVKVIDDDQKGEIIDIQKNQIIILNEYGFEEKFLSNELILDKGFEVNEVKIEPTETPKKKIYKKKIELAPKEIDLHIGELVAYKDHLSNYEMLQIQLQTVRDEIELARKEKRKKLIFIHGHGKGKLKKEVIKILESYQDLEFYDASFRKYNGGATKVKLK